MVFFKCTRGCGKTHNFCHNLSKTTCEYRENCITCDIFCWGVLPLQVLLSWRETGGTQKVRSARMEQSIRCLNGCGPEYRRGSICYRGPAARPAMDPQSAKLPCPEHAGVARQWIKAQGGQQGKGVAVAHPMAEASRKIVTSRSSLTRPNATEHNSRRQRDDKADQQIVRGR